MPHQLCKLEGYTYGPLSGIIIDTDSPDFYRIDSTCGQVSIYVRRPLVDYRNSLSSVTDDLPVFYYD